MLFTSGEFLFVFLPVTLLVFVLAARFAGRAAAGPCRDEVLSKEDETLLAGFARELPVALGLPPDRVILVFDSDRKAIYAGKTRAETRKCQAQAGMHVVDSYPVFQRYFAERQGPLIGPRWTPTGTPLRIGSWLGKWHASSNPVFGRASQLYFSDSLLNFAPFRRPGSGSARRKGSPVQGEGRGPTPSAPIKLER